MSKDLITCTSCRDKMLNIYGDHTYRYDYFTTGTYGLWKIEGDKVYVNHKPHFSNNKEFDEWKHIDDEPDFEQAIKEANYMMQFDKQVDEVLSSE